MHNLITRYFYPALALTVFALFAERARALLPPDHVVIVIMENHSFGQIIGSRHAPNINALAASGASIVKAADDANATRSGSHALRHPSQPNYLELFSGSNQRVLGNGLPGTSAEPLSPPVPFNTPNLGASLLKAGFTFAIYSESLPAVGSNVVSYTDQPGVKQYERKHNPAVNWQSVDAPANNHLPPQINQPFFPLPGKPGTGFPADFDQLPTVSFVVPNEQNDMHNGSIATADAWLKANIIDTYLAWAQTHNSLLILTFDEDDDNTATNHIPTIFAGPMIRPGNYPETDLNISKPDARAPSDFVTPTGTAMNHYNVLSTIEDFYALPRIRGSIGRPALTDIFKRSAFANESTRAHVGTGDNVIIGGFIIAGSTKKTIVLRGIGPSLAVNGSPVPGTLQDPVIELHRGDGTLLFANDNWKQSQRERIQATGLAPTDDRESAIVMSLDPGSYTVIVSGKQDTTGIALFEAYDIEPNAPAELLNVSTRGQVDPGNNVMIAGLIVAGPDTARVVVRALGPSLQGDGAPLAGTLRDPAIGLFDGNGSSLRFNNNWKDSQRAEIEQTGLAPSDDREAAIVHDLPPGNYTAIVHGNADATGIALVEAYKVD